MDWSPRQAVLSGVAGLHTDRRTTTTEERLPLNELLQKAGDGDFLRAIAESVLQLLMEADVEGLIGAGRHERAADRLNWRRYYQVPGGAVAALLEAYMDQGRRRPVSTRPRWPTWRPSSSALPVNLKASFFR